MGNGENAKFSESAALDAVALLAVPVVLALLAAFNVKVVGIGSLLVVFASVSLMFFGWERSKPALRQIMPSVVLGSLAAAGRILFAAIPNVQPVTAICVIAGASLGKRCGFMVGAIAALMSNFFLGQGPWTPWQMYSWGVVGYLAGVLFCGKGTFVKTPQGNLNAANIYGVRLLAISTFGFLGAFIFGFFMNTWMLFSFVSDVNLYSALAIYASGFVFDMSNAISTVVFLGILYVPWVRKLDRVCLRYGIACN